MIATSTKLTAAYVGLAAADAWLAGSTSRWARRARGLTKPLLMPALAGSLATDRRAFPSPLRTTTLTAQACGCAGDVALLREGTTAFTIGAGCFGAGHLAYVAGFVRKRDRSTALRRSLPTRIATGAFAVGGPVIAIGAAREDRSLAPAVLGYTGVLSTLLATAGHLGSDVPRSARAMSLAGAALFATSDTVLGFRMFWWRSAPQRTETVVMATYTLAQLLLSKGAARAHR